MDGSPLLFTELLIWHNYATEPLFHITRFHHARYPRSIEHLELMMYRKLHTGYV